jgi:hypothetical protein
MAAIVPCGSIAFAQVDINQKTIIEIWFDF